MRYHAGLILCKTCLALRESIDAVTKKCVFCQYSIPEKKSLNTKPNYLINKEGDKVEQKNYQATTLETEAKAILNQIKEKENLRTLSDVIYFLKKLYDAQGDV